jgi:putative spermidine/putrescine transport system substrate-binding protein
VYQDAQERALFEPFSRLTGAEIETDTTDLVTLRNQVENEEVEWDVCDVLSEDVLSLANVGILEPIDYNVVSQIGVFADATTEFGVGSSYFSTLLAFRADAWPGVPNPATWVDFWDLSRFPGDRGLYRDPRTTLEFALLADGVGMHTLYPLDVDRAFDSLDRIRPALTLFWEQGAQAAQSLTTGGLVMDSAWHNRILEIQGEGAAVNFVWDGAALAGDSWIIPRGAPNRDVAMDFINFATRPEPCAAFSTFAPFGPVNKGAFNILPPEIAANLPSSPDLRTRQFVLDYEWWFTHLDTVSPRFEDWLAEHP